MTTITKDDLKTLKQEIVNEIKGILNPQSTTTEFLRSSQVKQLLGCSDSKLETMRKNGSLTYTKIGGSVYYNQKDISKLFQN